MVHPHGSLYPTPHNVQQDLTFQGTSLIPSTPASHKQIVGAQVCQTLRRRHGQQHQDGDDQQDCRHNLPVVRGRGDVILDHILRQSLHDEHVEAEGQRQGAAQQAEA